MTLLTRLKSILKNSKLWILLSIIGWICIFAFSYLYEKLPVRVEVTLDKSLPYHVWVSLPYRERPFIEFPVYFEDKYFKKKNAQYLVKILACDEGEILQTVGKKYYCNGKYIGKALDKDIKGNPLKSFNWNGPIPEGKAFVVGTHPYSYDSRYFGFIDKNKIVRYLYPFKLVGEK